LKWLDLKDKNIILKSSFPISNKDLIINTKDAGDNEDLFDTSIFSILLCLSYTYMELRHFSLAVNCLDESMEYSDYNNADAFLRRSQARMYNKRSSDKDLVLALLDARKAFDLNKDMFYKEHMEKLESLIENRKKIKNEKILS
jgi:hypothetical protein